MPRAETKGRSTGTDWHHAALVYSHQSFHTTSRSRIVATGAKAMVHSATRVRDFGAQFRIRSGILKESINQSTLEESTRSRRTKHKSHGFHIWLNKCFEQCHEGHRGDISSYGPLVTEQRRGPSRRKSDGSRSRVPLEVPGGLSDGTDERLFCPS